MQKIVGEKLKYQLRQNPRQPDLIIEKCVNAARAREAARKARETVRKSALGAGGGLPWKTCRLCVKRSFEERALHCGGRLRGRFCKTGPQPSDAGNPANPRQAHKRGESSTRQSFTNQEIQTFITAVVYRH